MSEDRTVLRPPQPAFAVNEIAYARVSATKGYVEPLRIAGVAFDAAANQYKYTFRLDPIGPGKFTTDKPRLMPITLHESELINLCEALDIQIGVLERELAKAEQQLATVCNASEIQPETEHPIEIKSTVQPPRPRFGHYEVVYLTESAQTVGRLEAYRIDDLKWDNNLREWLYFFHIRPRPRRSTTVVDREDLRHGSIISYPESQICKVCEALPLVVKSLQIAVQRAKFRRGSLCPQVTASGS